MFGRSMVDSPLQTSSSSSFSFSFSFRFSSSPPPLYHHHYQHHSTCYLVSSMSSQTQVFTGTKFLCLSLKGLNVVIVNHQLKPQEEDCEDRGGCVWKYKIICAKRSIHNNTTSCRAQEWEASIKRNFLSIYDDETQCDGSLQFH